VIRDQPDLNRHIDDIHYNPVKHGLVLSPLDFEFSSYADYRNAGYYEDDWGMREKIEIDGDFGE
jgi:putative transposase